MTAQQFGAFNLLEHYLEQAQKHAVELARSDDARLKSLAGMVHGAATGLLRDVIRLVEESKVD